MSTIVYIGAVGRSGTTLIERTLATSPHVTALGEVVHLWQRGVAENEKCGCGVTFSGCEFWSQVGQVAFGGWDRVDAEQSAMDRDTVDRNRYIPYLIWPRLGTRSFRAAHRRWVAILDNLYSAVEEVAQSSVGGANHCKVLVDSSKHPSYLFLLRSLPSHRVVLLHVVRDPRGVAYSWSKEVARPESGTEMERLSSLRAVGRWTSHNLLFDLASAVGVTRERLSYGEFVRSPTTMTSAADALTGGRITQGGGLAIHGTEVTMGRDHTVSGNPSRFTTGTIALQSDDVWRASMSRRSRRLVSALTLPTRQAYRK